MQSVTACEGRRSTALWIAIACFSFLVGLSALVYPAANNQVLHLQAKLPPLHPIQNIAELCSPTLDCSSSVAHNMPAGH